jgi:hypothetical protein
LTEKKKDLISGFIFLVLALVLFAESFNIEYGNQGTLGPEFMPRVISVILFFLAGILLIFTLRSPSKTKKAEPSPVPAAKKPFQFNVSVWGTCALVIAYPLLLRPLGFIIISVIYLFCQIFLFTDKADLTKIRIITIGIIALTVPVSLYLLFNGVFYIFLPAGILG